jgi:hypothetical protein
MKLGGLCSRLAQTRTAVDKPDLLAIESAHEGEDRAIHRITRVPVSNDK